MRTREQKARSEILEDQVWAAHNFNEERTVGFQVYRTKRPKENINWLVGAVFLLFGTLLSVGRLTVIGQFFDDVFFNLPWGWLKFPVYLVLIVLAITFYFNYHFKFKGTFLLMLGSALLLVAWVMSLAVLTYLYDTQRMPYNLKIDHLWDRDIFTKSFKLYWLNWKDYSIFGASYAQTSKLDFLFKNQGYVTFYSAGGVVGYLLASASYYLSLPGAYIFYSLFLALTSTWLLTGDPFYSVKPKAARYGRALRLLPLRQKDKPSSAKSPLISTKKLNKPSTIELDELLADELLTLQQYDEMVDRETRYFSTSLPSTSFTDEGDEETLVPETEDLLTTPDLPTTPLPVIAKKPTFASTILQTNLNQKVTPHFQSRRAPVPVDQQPKITTNEISLAKLQQKREHKKPAPQATRQAQSAIYNRLDPQEARRLFERETSVTPFGKLAKNPIFKETHWPDYQLPSLALLDEPANQVLNQQYNQNYAEQVVNHLNHWLAEKHLDASCELLTLGEAVSRYQFNCGPNLNPLLLVNQEDSLASVARVKAWRWDYNPKAPNPLIFELPNQIPLKVSLKEVLQGIPNDKQSYRLLYALGKRPTGELLTANLANMPHVLVAGQHSESKTMVLSSLIASLLLRNTPDQVKLIIIDSPSKDLINFAHLPHLLAPYITNSHHIQPVIQKLIQTLAQRHQLFSELKVRTIEDYNQNSLDPLPYIVIIVNELQDLTSNLDSKLILPKLHQLTEGGHRFGLHLVIATNNPETTLIDEALKRNCPTRLALQLPSVQASQAILNEDGAEQLVSPGDLLFTHRRGTKLIRAQGVYLSPSELKRLLTFIYRQTIDEPK